MAKRCPSICDIPVQEIDSSIYEDQFKNMKETFAYMKRLNEQLCNELPLFSGHRTKVTSDGLPDPSPWDVITSSPQVQSSTPDDDKMTLIFDVKEFEPSEVQVSIKDNKLTVQATHQEAECSTELFREFRLPTTADSDYMEYSVDQGILTVTIPLNGVGREGSECLCGEEQIES